MDRRGDFWQETDPGNRMGILRDIARQIFEEESVLVGTFAVRIRFKLIQGEKKSPESDALPVALSERLESFLRISLRLEFDFLVFGSRVKWILDLFGTSGAGDCEEEKSPGTNQQLIPRRCLLVDQTQECKDLKQEIVPDVIQDAMCATSRNKTKKIGKRLRYIADSFYSRYKNQAPINREKNINKKTNFSQESATFIDKFLSFIS